MSKKSEHFETKYPHTEIKHKLLSKTLEICLSISNSYNNKNNEQRKFTYMDLYAGCGEFDDNTEGSPVIAFNLIESQLNLENNNFNEINMIATESNTENANKLKDNLQKLLENCSHKALIKTSISDKGWEECKKELTEFITNSQWGFVFVDPFSTELNLGQLKELINNNIYYKDILILINNNAHERILGRKDDQSLEKISEYFDVDLKIIKLLKKFAIDNNDTDVFDNAKIIRFLINNTFKDIDKDFIINLAIPRSRKGELENSDRFYLCLITGSIGVANEFLRTYSDLLGEKEQANKGGQLDLFSNNVEMSHFKLNEKIKEIMTKEKVSTLFRLVSKLFNDFYSWKKASQTEIPTSENLQTALNFLLENNQVDLITDCFLDKRCKSKKRLTTEAFKSKANLRQVKFL